MYTIGTAGKKVSNTASDCHISINIQSEGGLQIDLISNSENPNTKWNRELVSDMLQCYKVQHARITINETNAPGYVIAARMEAAIKQVLDTKLNYLLPQRKENTKGSDKNKSRISLFCAAGDSPELFMYQGINNPSGLILDLEKNVSQDKKGEARIMVRHALRSMDFHGSERMVRINQIPKGLDDLRPIVSQYVNLILIPKCEASEDIHRVNEVINIIKKEHKVKQTIWLIPLIENALGVIKSFEIASASYNVAALAFGTENYQANMGIQHSTEGNETLFARNTVLHAAKAAGIQAIDSFHSNMSKTNTLLGHTKASRDLGFDGMLCGDLRQVDITHQYFNTKSKYTQKT